MAELKPTQSKTKKVMTDLINKSKDKFNTNIDENDENIRIRTDEISQNALTGLFLVLTKGQWHGFPLQMQLVWVLCIIMGSGIQWITLLLLYLYTRDQEVDPLSEDKGGQAVAALSVMTSTLILFIYVLAEFRRAGMTLYQYWGVFINEISAELSWNNLLYVFTLIFLIGKIAILGTVTILSTMSINQQNNISDQLGIALSYFFLLEVDEWIYQALIEDFDVLEEDDFFLTSKEIIKADSDEEFQKKKAKHGIYWTVLLAILTIWSGGVWYWYASKADDE